jgi:hypothetical protein
MKLIAKLSQDRNKLFVLFAVIAMSVMSVQRLYPTENIYRNLNTEHKFKLFPFAFDDVNSTPIKTAYFAKEPYKKFLKLKQKANILFASSASFTLSLDMDKNIPVGFCSENGNVLNKMPHHTMDGLVVINNNSPEINNVKIIDFDEDVSSCKKVKCTTHFTHYNIRDNSSDMFDFIATVEENRNSCFQTQLVYSSSKSDADNFATLNNGKNDRTRRFLSICEKDDLLYHVIVDGQEEDYLMASAKKAIEFLRSANYKVKYIVNLDTGSKNIIHSYDGEDLINLRPKSLTSSAIIENAASLLVYYTDI